MKEHIINYFINEKQVAEWGILSGIVFILVAVLLWPHTGAETLLRGLTVALLVTA